MFNRLQVIVGQLQFMDVEVEHDDLNQKFLTSLASEWLMHTIVWRNRSDLDTMSLDDLYNHLKVYESKVQKKSEPNSQNMAFISSAKHSRGNEDGNSASVSTASTNVPTASANIRISEDDMKEMDIKWSMAFLSMRADKFWKKTWKKISIQGSDMDGFDKSKVECFNCHKMGHFTRECRAPRSKDKGRRDNYKQGSKVEEQVPKALMAIDGELETLKKEKERVDSKLAGFLTTSKDLDNLIESQRSDKNKEGLGYSAVPPPPPAQIYSSPKKDLLWTRLPEFADDTVTDYSLNFVMKRKACFNCGDFDHLAYDCRKRVKKGTSRSQNNTHESFTPRPVVHRPYRPLVKPINMNGARPNRISFNKEAHSYENRPFQRTSVVRSQFRALWVPTANRNFPPVSRKFSTVTRNFPTVNRKFPTANGKFSTGGINFPLLIWERREKQ
nr:hypothetical protein [Tanacetum cinerariifolium]